MRSIVVFMLVFLQGVASYSIAVNTRGNNKRSALVSPDRKTDRLYNSANTGNGVPPGVLKPQDRKEVPGKHRQGAWFLNTREKTLTKRQKKKLSHQNETPGRGRQFSYGKVSWW